MSSYVFPENSLPLITNPALKSTAELELENFRSESTIGGNTYQIIRTNFVIDDEISLRVRQSVQKDAQARLLIAQKYGSNYNIQDVNLNAFRNLTQRQLTIIRTYLLENQ